MSEIVVNSYRENGGKEYICYLPAQADMDKVGEKPGPKPDKLFQSDDVDYPQKDILLIKNSDCAIALNGGLGTLTEIIHGIYDYNKKVAVIDFGPLAEWVKSIKPIQDKVFLTKSVEEAIKYIIM